MLKVIIRIEKKSDALYMGVNIMATNSNKYYIYTADLF